MLLAYTVLSVSDVQEVLAAAGRVYARRDLETALSALLMDKRVCAIAAAAFHHFML
jgi:hypothetical protein